MVVPQHPFSLVTKHPKTSTTMLSLLRGIREKVSRLRDHNDRLSFPSAHIDSQSCNPHSFASAPLAPAHSQPSAGNKACPQSLF